MDQKTRDKNISKYAKAYRQVLAVAGFDRTEDRLASYHRRLSEMYDSQNFRKHNIYPSTNTTYVYAVMAMCLEMREAGMSDNEIIKAIDDGFAWRRKMFKWITGAIDILPNCFSIARKWNISDHEKRVKDGSITYDYFNASPDKVDYYISKCMYVEMFAAYGIRGLCKIFCMTDEMAYAGLTKHVKFIRHSDLSDGPACFDEVIRKPKSGMP